MEDRVKRMIVAIDILKAAISKDVHCMISCEMRYERASNDRTLEGIKQGLIELALDVLCGEQPLPL